MGIVAKDRFVELMKGNNALHDQVSGAIGGSRSQQWYRKNDTASLHICYDAIRDYVKQQGWLAGKYLRPWLIDPKFGEDLDRREVWWGFEFETGYRSREARAEVIHYTWDNYDGVVYDAEGEGNAQVEITFTPQERSKFLDGTAQAVRFLDYLTANPKLVMKGDSVNIGTHLNISSAGMDAGNVNVMTNALNRTVGNLPLSIAGHGNVRLKMFGRDRLYGGFFQHVEGGKAWIEGKLFRTTYTREGFNNYIKTSDAISRALMAIEAALVSKEELASSQRLLKAYPYVDNLWEMYRDATVEPVVMWSKGNVGDRGSVNNGFNKDSHQEKHPQDLKAIKVEADKKRKEEEDRQKKLAEAKRLEALEAQLRVSHTKLFKAKQTPANLPKGYTYCEDCEVFHDEDGKIWEAAE